MFNWFWRFLYGISRSLFRIIDGLAACANKLCGIESIYINGTETDFLTYIIKSDFIANGFRIAVVAGMAPSPLMISSTLWANSRFSG